MRKREVGLFKIKDLIKILCLTSSDIVYRKSTFLIFFVSRRYELSLCARNIHVVFGIRLVSPEYHLVFLKITSLFAFSPKYYLVLRNFTFFYGILLVYLDKYFFLRSKTCVSAILLVSP